MTKVILMTNFAAAVLAGGQSLRMGHDKSKLKIKEKSLTEWMVEILKRSGIKHIYISHSDAISDVIPSLGPLSGIHSVLNKLIHSSNQSFEQVIFVPIDMPNLNFEVIKKMMKVSSKYQLVQYKNQPLPLCIALTKKNLALAEKILKEKKQVSLKYFSSQIEDRLELDWTFLNQDIFDNINTYHQWQSFINKTE